MESIIRDLNNPRIHHAPITMTHDTPVQKAREISPITNTPDIKEYNNKVCRENKTKLTILRDKNGYLYSSDLSQVATKCAHNHPHLTPLNDIADGMASCPTCVLGTMFSRKVVLLLRNEFDITLIIKDPHQNMKDTIIYHNPIQMIEVRCELDKDDDFFEVVDNIFIIHIHSKSKGRMITFLKNALISGKKINAKKYHPLPFSIDSAANYYGNGLIDEGLIVDDRLMLFENT